MSEVAPHTRTLHGLWGQRIGEASNPGWPSKQRTQKLQALQWAMGIDSESEDECRDVVRRLEGDELQYPGRTQQSVHDGRDPVSPTRGQVELSIPFVHALPASSGAVTRLSQDVRGTARDRHDNVGHCCRK